MSGWTPGPWEIGEQDTFVGELMVNQSGNDDAPPVGCVFTRDVQRSPKEILATARLIAAAPQLYEALEKLVRFASNPKCCEICGKFRQPDGRVHHTDDCAFDAAQAILAAVARAA